MNEHETEIGLEIAGIHWSIPVIVSYIHTMADDAHGCDEDIEVCGMMAADPKHQVVVDSIPPDADLHNALAEEIMTEMIRSRRGSMLTVCGSKERFWFIRR